MGRGQHIMRRLLFWLVSAFLATALAACETVQEPTVRDAAVVAPVAPAGPDPVQEPTDVKYYPSDEPVRMGLEQFNRGSSGCPSGISRMRLKRLLATSPRGLAWLRATTDCGASILPIRPMRRRFGWAAKPFRS